MYSIKIDTVNPKADAKYLDQWLKQNYPDHFSGFTIGSKVNIIFHSEIQDYDEVKIVDFYNSIEELDCLHIYKSQKNELIRIKTDYLISLGYTFETSVGEFKTFPLVRDNQIDPQINILALKNTDDLVFPIVFNTIDNLDYFECNDSVTLASIYLRALSIKKQHEESSTILMNQVRQCNTKAEVYSVNDNR